MDIDALRSLFDLLNEKGIYEFEHEDEKLRVRVVRGQGGAPPQAFHVATAPSTLAPATGPQASASAAPKTDDGVVDVTSPFVGTFYRSPSPDAPSFVEVGSTVRHGQTLCIIEAMKLMNELEAEFAGTVVEIPAQNGKAVEYGQVLFRIRKA